MRDELPIQENPLELNMLNPDQIEQILHKQ